jgi:hypothetical protein
VDESKVVPNPTTMNSNVKTFDNESKYIHGINNSFELEGLIIVANKAIPKKTTVIGNEILLDLFSAKVSISKRVRQPVKIINSGLIAAKSMNVKFVI